jgi:hypothetical protein
MRLRKYHFIAFWFSFVSMFKQGLGDYVKVNGKLHTIINGTRPKSWLIGFDGEKEIWVLRSECKKRMLPKDMFFSFIRTWKFYKTSWFSIWEHDKCISNFSRGCNIWGGYKWKRGSK